MQLFYTMHARQTSFRTLVDDSPIRIRPIGPAASANLQTEGNLDEDVRVVPTQFHIDEHRWETERVDFD